jgi:hypothetical protein
VTSPLVNPIAEELRHYHSGCKADCPGVAIGAADAVIAVVAALPADYTAVDVLAFLRGDAGDPPEYEPEDEA